MSHRNRFVPLVAGLALLAAAPADAGIGSPVPTVRGQKARVIATITGVVNTDALATVVTCTSNSPADFNLGVEFFSSNGQPVNDPSTLQLGNGSAVVEDMETVSIGTGITVYAGLALFQPPTIRQGSARILSTSSNISCTAAVVARDGNVNSWLRLPVYLKTRQRGD